MSFRIYDILPQTFDSNVELNGLDTQKKLFLAQWSELFPGTDAPDVNFDDEKDVGQQLMACKKLINNLEERLNQEKFYLLFLQTYLGHKKKDCFVEPCGFNSNGSTAYTTFKELVNPCLQAEDKEKTLSETDSRVNKTVIFNEELKKNDLNSSCIKQTNFEVMRPNSNNSSTDSGKPTAVEHAKRFQPQSAISSVNVHQNGIKTPLANRKSSKRGSYVEVWECGSNLNKQSGRDTAKVVHRRSNPEVNSILANMASASKPLSTHRSMRNDYEEVWTCSTGTGKTKLSSSDQHQNNNGRNLSIDDYIKELETQQDFAIENIKNQENLKNEPPCPKLRSKVARHKPPRRNRDNRLAVIPSSQDTEREENTSHGFGPQSGGYSAGVDLSELDHRMSDSQSKSSEDDEYPSYRPAIPTHLSDTSPLLRMRRAQTTNERMSVAYSAFQEWSDDEPTLPERSPLYSARSADFASSDDDAHYQKDDVPPPVPAKPTAMSHNKDIKRLKNVDAPTQHDETNSKRKSTVSIDGSGAEVFGSPQKEAVSHMVDYQKVRSIAEAEKLTMRIWVLNSLLDTEAAYLQYLDTLLLYMKPLKATIATSKPVMSIQDFDTLFYRVPEIHDLHSLFYTTLKPRLDTWSADTTVGDLFKQLLSKLNLYGEYLNNYKRAQHTIEKCAKENVQFAQIIESLTVKSRDMKGSESISLVEVLYKPVERVMRTTLVLQDLLKYTPHRHPDYPVLREVLKQSQIFLDRINSTSTSAFRPRRVVSSAVAAARSADRELVKHGFLVEVASDGSRKLRHCFLFSDLLLCAKPKNTAGVFHSKTSYECKWYIPLADLSFQAREDSEVTPDVPSTSEEELHELSVQAQQLKYDISREHEKLKEQKTADGYPVKSRKEERLKKKLAEVEARLVLATPDLPLRIYHMEGKSYMFLMSSDYERNEWSEAIMKRQENCFKSFSLTPFEINLLLATCVKQRKLNNIGSMLIREDEDLLSGYLSVKVLTGHGFLTTCNPYCTLEVDSYGQFQTKAKTRACQNTKTPNWNEEFELDVDGAMTLRILCYDRARDMAAGSSYSDDDVLIAKGKLGFSKKTIWEKGEWVKECIRLNDLTICIAVKYLARETSLQRVPSQKSNGVFGVKIETVAKRDSSGVPNIVRCCIAEVEKRGMDEVGIYRVSGVASEIQTLKEAFDTDRKDVNSVLGDVDIHAVAGVLKLYFRELPEPLFSDNRYKNFIEASSLTDPETKQRTITRLLSDLPVSNYKTLSFLRQHLVNVANESSVNKMTFHNLATVFGPTLLRPAEDKTPKHEQSLAHATMMLNALRMDIHSQMDILMYCLQMDDMPDYDVLKRSLSREETVILSQNFSNLNMKQDNASSFPEVPNSPISPKVPAQKPVSPQPRFHPYEEIFIPPKRNAKPHIVPPPRKPRPAKLSHDHRDNEDYYSTGL